MSSIIHPLNYVLSSSLVYSLTTPFHLLTLSQPSCSYSPTYPNLSNLLAGIPQIIAISTIKRIVTEFACECGSHQCDCVVATGMCCLCAVSHYQSNLKAPSQILAPSQISQSNFCFLSPTHHKQLPPSSLSPSFLSPPSFTSSSHAPRPSPSCSSFSIWSHVSFSFSRLRTPRESIMSSPPLKLTTPSLLRPLLLTRVSW